MTGNKKWGKGWNSHLKIKKAHYINLEKAIHKVLTDKPLAYKDCRRAGWSNTQFNWDLFYHTLFVRTTHDDLKYVPKEQMNIVLQKITGKKERR